MRFRKVGLACFLGIPMAAGQVLSAAWDILDESDPGPPPPGVIVLDAFVDIAASDAWSSAGIRCVTSNGASMIYTYDPDSGAPVLVNTGSINNRFTTVLSRPRGRNAAARFDNGAVDVAAPIANTTEFSASFFADPPPAAGSPSVDGYVIRLAIFIPGESANTVVLTTSPIPPNPISSILLLSIEGPGGATSPGWINTTFDNPTPNSAANVYLWGDIPEPTMLGLFLVGLAFARRR